MAKTKTAKGTVLKSAPKPQIESSGIAISTVDRKRLHTRLDYVLTYGSRSMMHDRADHLRMWVDMNFDQLKSELDETADQCGKQLADFPGLVLDSSILKKLGLGTNSHARAYVRWRKPGSKTEFTPTMEISLDDYNPSFLGGRLTCLGVNAIVNGIRLKHDSADRIDINTKDQPKFICPFPKESKEWNGRCHQSVDQLFLPAGQTIFGCASCYGLSGTPEHYWASLSFNLIAWRTTKEKQDTERKNAIKRIGNLWIVDLIAPEIGPKMGRAE